jgi:hypothetical protein
MSLISAVASRGDVRFIIEEKDRVNADVFIEFLKRLMVGAKNKIATEYLRSEKDQTVRG